MPPTIGRVQIILHAGLHKSGTTSVQAGWSAAYAEHPDVWYPRRGHGPPGHHDLFRPLLVAFSEGRAADLAGARARYALRGHRGPGLATSWPPRPARGTGTLMLSSESLDRAVEEDAPRLVEALGDHDLTVVLTVTRPVHRWCSGWQTLVKQGLAQYPREAAPHILDFAALRAGGWPSCPATPRHPARGPAGADLPPEPGLAGDLAASLGLPDHERAAEQPMRNTSLGIDTEVVLRINRADLALGTSQEGKRLLAELRGDGFSYRDGAGLGERYALTDAIAEGAASETAWLAAPGPGVDVLDPHGLLTDWADPTVPEWYAEISRREAVVPALEPREDRETQLWRVRQERAAYQRRVQRERGRP